jgi:hypothetical protein
MHSTILSTIYDLSSPSLSLSAAAFIIDATDV